MAIRVRKQYSIPVYSYPAGTTVKVTNISIADIVAFEESSFTNLYEVQLETVKLLYKHLNKTSLREQLNITNFKDSLIKLDAGDYALTAFGILQVSFPDEYKWLEYNLACSNCGTEFPIKLKLDDLLNLDESKHSKDRPGYQYRDVITVDIDDNTRLEIQVKRVQMIDDLIAVKLIELLEQNEFQQLLYDIYQDWLVIQEKYFNENKEELEQSVNLFFKDESGNIRLADTLKSLLVPLFSAVESIKQINNEQVVYETTGWTDNDKLDFLFNTAALISKSTEKESQNNNNAKDAKSEETKVIKAEQINLLNLVDFGASKNNQTEKNRTNKLNTQDTQTEGYQTKNSEHKEEQSNVLSIPELFNYLKKRKLANSFNLDARVLEYLNNGYKLLLLKFVDMLAALTQLEQYTLSKIGVTIDKLNNCCGASFIKTFECPKCKHKNKIDFKPELVQFFPIYSKLIEQVS